MATYIIVNDKIYRLDNIYRLLTVDDKTSDLVYIDPMDVSEYDKALDYLREWL